MIVVQISLRPVWLLIGAPGSVPGASQRIISAHNAEATGRRVKMHRRRGHVRTYHRGMPNEFTGYIDPVWINAIAGVTPPPVVYTLEGV
jgi:hypothetical protein